MLINRGFPERDVARDPFPLVVVGCLLFVAIVAMVAVNTLMPTESENLLGEATATGDSFKVEYNSRTPYAGERIVLIARDPEKQIITHDVTWNVESTDPSDMQVTDDGKHFGWHSFIADRPGTVHMSATWNGETIPFSIDVRGGFQREEKFEISGPNTVRVGETISFSAKYDPGETCDSLSECGCRNNEPGAVGPAFICPMQGQSVSASWSSTDSSVLSSLGNGQFRGEQEGFAKVGASYDGKSAVAIGVTVLDPNAPEDTGEYDVELVQSEPIRTGADTDWRHDTHPEGWVESLITVEDNGETYFVASGHCDMWGDIGWGRGGMYLFSSSGEYIGHRNVCLDAQPPPPRCKHDLGCHAYSKAFPLGGGAFVRQLGYGIGSGRPAIVYDVGQSDFQRLGQTHFGFRGYEQVCDPFTQDCSMNELSPDEYYGVGHVAIASSVLVTEEAIGTSLPSGKRNGYYRLPGMTKITDHGMDFWPFVGVGEYFLATDGNAWSVDPPGVYRLPSAEQLAQGQRPEKVQTLEYPVEDAETYGVAGYTVDRQNPERIALIIQVNRERGPNEEYRQPRRFLDIYTAGPDGLELERRKELDEDDLSSPHTIPWEALDLSGEYLAYGRCPPEEERPLPDGYGGPSTSVGCELVVEKDGQPLSVAPLPLAPPELSPYPKELRAQRVTAIAISPEGMVMVAAGESWGDSRSGTLYLYQIVGGGTNGMDVPAKYAPSKDPDDNSQLLRASMTNGELTVSAENEYVYRTGYYLKNNAWTPFTFDEQTVEGSDWIKSSATKELQNVPTQGWVIAYTCEQLDGEWTCGQNRTGEKNARRWAIVNYKNKIEGPGWKPPPGGGGGGGGGGSGGTPQDSCSSLPRAECMFEQPENGTPAEGTCFGDFDGGNKHSIECYQCDEGFVPGDGDDIEKCVPDSNETEPVETSTKYVGGSGGTGWNTRIDAGEYDATCPADQCVDAWGECIPQGSNMIRPPGAVLEGTPHPRWICSDTGAGAAFYYCSWQHAGDTLPGTDLTCCHTPDDSPEYQFKESC